MSTYKTKFQIQVGNEKKGDVWDMYQVAEVPFLPRKGDMIAVRQGDDFREVHQIYWGPKDGFEVFFIFEETSKTGIKFMETMGWKEDE